MPPSPESGLSQGKSPSCHSTLELAVSLEASPRKAFPSPGPGGGSASGAAAALAAGLVPAGQMVLCFSPRKGVHEGGKEEGVHGQRGLRQRGGQNGCRHPDVVSSLRIPSPAPLHPAAQAPRRMPPAHFTKKKGEDPQRVVGPVHRRQSRARTPQPRQGRRREPHTALVRWEARRGHRGAAQPRISLEKQK